MEVASGEYEVDLVRAAKTMDVYKPDPAAVRSWDAHVPTITASPSPLGKILFHLKKLRIPFIRD